MGNFLIMAHSGWRYVVLLALIVGLIKYAIGFFGNGKWSSFDSTLARITPIVIDIQVVLGILVYIMFGMWQSSVPGIAYWHPLVMILAVVAAHYFFMAAKTATADKTKFQQAFLGSLVTLLLVALGIYFVLGGWNIFGMS